MLENIAILAGVSALVVSIMACVAFLLLKKNIKDILQKDALIFDKNFEIKKSVVSESFNIADLVEKESKSILLNKEYLERAKKCYNDLLCVLTNPQLVQAFYNIALNGNYAISSEVISTYKILCRKDIGLKVKNLSAESLSNVQPIVAPATPQQPQTNDQAEPDKFVEKVEPVETITEPESKPVQPQPRQIQPKPAVRPATRPVVRPAQSRPVVKTATRPATQEKPTSSEEQKK